jgi:hypothetical protein
MTKNLLMAPRCCVKKERKKERTEGRRRDERLAESPRGFGELGQVEATYRALFKNLRKILFV